MGVKFDPLLGQLRTTDASPLTTKGDIFTFSTKDARFGVGGDGTVLSADSSQTTGLKWIAAGGTGTVTNVSVVTANGVSGSVANATTTPAITLTLGAITPTSVNVTETTSSTTIPITAKVDGSAANVTALTVADGTTYAYSGNLETISLVNASDTGKALVISNKGTGKSLSITDGTSEVASITQVGNLAALNFSGNSSGTNTGDQTITLTGNVTGSGTGSFATTIQSSVALAGSPTTTTQTSTDNSTKIATTAYVTTGINNAIAGVNPAIAVQAATTAASDTSGLTYNNGVSGVGATLTGSNNTAITVDGYTFTALNQRILVKNDTQSPSGAFNGVYYVTQVQTAILPPILTRALDYDMPSDINNTGAIPVVNGTLNALTSWLLTSSVTTVGTDPLTYSKFSRSPTSVLTPDLGGTGIANNAASTLTISGNFGTTLTVSGTTSLTLPTSGTVTALGNTTTGSGSIVLATSPALTTPTLGVASATTINKVTLTTPATGSTLTIPDGVTLTGPASSGTAATLANTETLTNKIVSDTFMGDVYDNQGAIKQSAVLTASTDFLAIQGIDISGSNGLEIPATSSLEITGYATQSGGTVGTSALANQSVTSNKLSTGAQYATVATSQTTTSASYTDLATVGPICTVTIGVNGMAWVQMSADAQNNTANSYSVIAFDISGATTRAPAPPYESFYQHYSSNTEIKLSYGVLVTGLTPGITTFTLKYKIVTASTSTFQARELSVLPL